MPALILNDTVRVTLNGVIGSQPIANVVDVKAARPITGNSSDIAQAVSDSWQNNVVNGILADAYTYLGAHFIDLDSDTGDVGDIGADPALGVVGNQGASAPPNVAYVVKKVGVSTPRGVRGRMFLASVSEAAVNGAGLLTSGAVGQINDQMELFRGDIDQAAGPSTSEWHIVLSTFPRDISGNITGPGTTYDLDHYVCNAKVGTQRDRLG